MADYYTEYSFEIEAPKEKLDFLEDSCASADESEDMALGTITREDETHLWFRGDGGCDIQALADVLASWNKEHGDAPIAVEWAMSCSKPRLDGFGGGAFVILPDGTQHWNSTTQFIMEVAAAWNAEHPEVDAQAPEKGE